MLAGLVIAEQQGVFKHFASKNQLPGFYMSGTLAENGLMMHSRILHLVRRNCRPESNAGILKYIECR